MRQISIKSFLLLVVLSLVLAACQPAATPTQPPQPTQPQAQPTQPPQPTAAPTPTTPALPQPT
ncbi:MAG: hypothetical protein N2646_06690, partial [Bellilinea sp.]|nr:hypothetical protein [Bellilinea sp.]